MNVAVSFQDHGPNPPLTGLRVEADVHPRADGVASVPDAESMLTGQYLRIGDDLALLDGDGGVILVHGFFAADPPPDLVAPNGARLSGDVASRLAGPRTPGQIAQAGDLPSAEPIGRIEILSGDVVLQRADGTREAAREGTPVFQGDVISTGADGAIGILFADDTSFSLGNDGRMVLDEMVYDPGAGDGALSLSVVTGVFSMISGQIAKLKPDAMVISTPTAVIGIRGTAGAGGVEGADGGTIFALAEELGGQTGEVVFSTGDGRVTTLNQPGQGTNNNHDVFLFSAADFGRQFGSALGSLPNADQHLPAGFRREVEQAHREAQRDQTDPGQDEGGDEDTGDTAPGGNDSGGTTGGGNLFDGGLNDLIGGTVNELIGGGTGDAGGDDAVADAGSGDDGDTESEGTSLDDAEEPDDDNDDVPAEANNGGTGGTVGGWEIQTGTGGNDLLVGTVDAASASILGDAISGGDGDDTIIGDTPDSTASPTAFPNGGSRDAISGGMGDDQIWGGPGDDSITGDIPDASDAAGDDDLDVLLDHFADHFANQAGAEGNDTIHGGDGDDDISGDGGDDTLYGDADDDELRGDGGDDTLDGGTGDDTLDGGTGDDTLDGGTGDDTLDGGTGDDTLLASTGATAASYDGGTGDDILDFGNVGSGVTVTMSVNTSVVSGGTGGAFTNIEKIIGTAFDDELNGSAGGETLDGGAGNDTLDGGVGDDVLLASTGATTADYDGGVGFDVLSFENVTGGVTLDMRTGTISGDTGGTFSNIEKIEGSTGNDTLVADDSDSISTYAGGDGTDTLSFAGFSAGVTASLLDGTVTHGGGTDTLSGFEALVGSAFVDVLVGSDGKDTLDGNGGDDTLDGGAGNDTLLASTGATTADYDGGSGENDTLSFENIGSAVTVDMQAGTISGGTAGTFSNIESIVGSALDDSLTGSTGNDVLDGGAGDDTMIGGLGDDIYVVDSAGDIVTENSGEGTDKVKSALSYTLDAEIENLKLTGTSDIDGTGHAGDNVLEGNNSDNVLSGLGGADELHGNAGNDTLEGGAGDDTLYGGSGVDELKGNAGSDIFNFLLADFDDGMVADGDNHDIVSYVSAPTSSDVFRIYTTLTNVSGLNATPGHLATLAYNTADAKWSGNFRDMGTHASFTAAFNAFALLTFNGTPATMLNSAGSGQNQNVFLFFLDSATGHGELWHAGGDGATQASYSMVAEITSGVALSASDIVVELGVSS